MLNFPPKFKLRNSKYPTETTTDRLNRTLPVVSSPIVSLAVIDPVVFAVWPLRRNIGVNNHRAICPGAHPWPSIDQDAVVTPAESGSSQPQGAKAAPIEMAGPNRMALPT